MTHTTQTTTPTMTAEELTLEEKQMAHTFARVVYNACDLLSGIGMLLIISATIIFCIQQASQGNW